MRRVGYRPNGTARALATQRHGAIGLVFPHLSGPYYAGVLQGVEAEATAQGVNLAIIGTHERSQAADLVNGLGSRVDGLIVMGRTVDDRVIADLQARQLAVVVLARPGVGRADVVCSENRESAFALAAHLIGHGHRQIAFIGDPASSPDAAERWQGFRGAHRKLGLPLPMRPVVSPFREVEGRSAALQALATPSRPTALFCANDEIAMGAYAAAAELGLTIPTDVAITGWDDIPVARFLAPRLTTVRQPLSEIGKLATRLLLERIMAKRQRPTSIVLPTEIIIRSSCGCQS
jgi:LacI family transcriptional regulator